MKLIPVLAVSTNSTGNHMTIFPVGTKADALIHDYDNETGKPTFGEGVYVEFVTPEHEKELRERGKMTFSSEEEFFAWCEE